MRKQRFPYCDERKIMAQKFFCDWMWTPALLKRSGQSPCISDRWDPLHFRLGLWKKSFSPKVPSGLNLSKVEDYLHAMNGLRNLGTLSVINFVFIRRLYRVIKVEFLLQIHYIHTFI